MSDTTKLYTKLNVDQFIMIGDSKVTLTSVGRGAELLVEAKPSVKIQHTGKFNRNNLRDK